MGEQSRRQKAPAREGTYTAQRSACPFYRGAEADLFTAEPLTSDAVFGEMRGDPAPISPMDGQ